MNKKGLILAVAVGILFQANAFAQKKGKEVETPPENEEYIFKIDKKELQIQNLYIEAVNESLLGNVDDAVELFLAVTKLDPDNHAAYYELSRIAYGLGNLVDAEKFALKAIKLNPKNEWYHIYLAEAKLAKGDYKGAALAYENLIKELPKLVEYYHDIAYMYSRGDMHQEAIDVYNKIEAIEGISENISIQKQSHYIQLEKVDKAAEEILKLANAFPTNDEYLILLGELYSANGFYKKAIESYEMLLKRDANNPHALLAISEIQRKSGDDTAYKETIKKVFGNPDLDIDTKIFMFLPYLEGVVENPKTADEVLEMALLIKSVHPDNAKAQTAYADVLYNTGKREEAIEAYKLASAYEDSPITVWLQLYDLFLNTKDYASLKTYGEKGAVKFLDDATPLFYTGVACSQLKDYKCAIQNYELALKMEIPNPQGRAQILSSLGDAYYNLENFTKSDSCYEEVLVINPNDAFTLNNYAYYLSLREVQLEKAERMSRRSNILVENNSSFQDTYAWIKFIQGDYKEAKVWMEKAMESMKIDGGDSPVMFEHYGDILFKLEDINGAILYWKKALDAGGDKSILEEKIRTKSLVK
jgi:tetratricopeptide (TPR) repeat protein